MADPSALPDPAPASAVEEAILSRRSVRAFLPDPVPIETVRRLLAVAGRAPSGSNIQPWRVRVLVGEALRGLCAELTAAFDAGTPETPEYDYYPEHWRAPYVDRRRASGWGLYALAGVERGDREGAARQRRLNYTFFGAPVGMIFTVDRDLGRGSWVDYGMFLQSIMVAARGCGLDTCPQAALINYPAIVRRRLLIPDGEALVCGMALGHADPAAPTNRLLTGREAVDAFVTVHGAPEPGS